MPIRFSLKRILALIYLIIISSGFFAPVQADTEKPVSLQLRWDHQFQFAGYYAALWEGYYADEGMDVEIRSAFRNSEVLDAAAEVNSGRSDFGVGAANLLIAQDSGMKLKLVASIFQRSAVDYCTLRNEEANTVYELSQLHLARRPGDLMDLELQALFSREGISPHAGNPTTLTRDFNLEDLRTGRFDVVPEFLGQISYEASQQGVPLHIIRPAEYGVDFYGDTLFTSEALASKDPDLVERFRRATIRGWRYALENPEEISQRIVGMTVPTGDTPKLQAERLAFNLFQAEHVLGLTHYPIVEIGNINPYRWNQMATMMKELDMIHNIPDFETLIFDYNRVRMARLEKTKRNIAIGLGTLIAFLIIAFFVYLKRRNSLLQHEILVRESAERQLILSNSRYETIFKSAVLGITITDYSGKIHHVNEAWCRMTGYEADELCTMNIQDLIAPESSGMDDSLLENLRHGHITSYTLEKKYLRRPSESDTRPFFHGRMALTQIWDMSTDTYLTMSMVTDITRDVLDSEAVRRSETRFRRIVGQVAQQIAWTADAPDVSRYSNLPMNLEAINMELESLFTRELEENRRKDALIRYQSRMAAMGEMIGNIAHQWRQPLNTLKLVLLNLRESDDDPEYTQTAFIKADRLIRRMSETIDDFRYFSKPQHMPCLFYIEDAARGVLGLMEENLRIAGITVHISLSRLPQIFGLENHLSHVLFNLLSNAIEALKTNPPEQARTLQIIGDPAEDRIYLFIEDSGPGIPQNQADHIFDMYYTTKETEGGTGLGLYMARAIIENSFNGSIQLLQQTNGCRFELCIPLTKAGEAQ